MDELSNIASAVGTYNGLSTSLTSDSVVVPLVSGLTITKTADKASWADGALTFTITINNQATESYENPVITDVIDTTLVNFVPESVYINGVKAEASEYSYNNENHTLTINLQTIATTTTATATFQVSKIA